MRTSGVASAGQTLNAGQNTVVVRVTAMDTTTQDYTVNAVLRPSGSVPNVTSSVSGPTLTLAWPATHLGYELQTQTNSASTGLGSTWFTVPGSSSTNSINLNIDPANPTVFFRLLYMFP